MTVQYLGFYPFTRAWRTLVALVLIDEGRRSKTSYILRACHTVERGGGERERERDRETDRQTDRQTDRDGDRDTKRQRQRQRQIDRERHSERRRER